MQAANTRKSRRILITGARAPVALELARILSRAGHHVTAADSLSVTLCQASRAVKGHVTLPSPRHDFAAFRRALQDAVRNHRIDLVLPTCEEVFHVAKVKPDLAGVCEVLCSSEETLLAVHDKDRFVELVRGQGRPVPETHRIEGREQLHAYLAEPGSWVLKPVFSRFAADIVFLKQGGSVDPRLEISSRRPWVLQEHLQGRHLSSYSVAKDGAVLAHAAYPISFRAGLGAAIYFEAATHPACEAWVRDFVVKTNFTGQIAFDFIESPAGLMAIECNPRATSGVHLLARDPCFADAIAHGVQSPSHAPKEGAMLGLAMVLYAPQNLSVWWQHRRSLGKIFGARDVLFRWLDPLPPFLGIAYTVITWWKSRQLAMSMLKATTFDIECNGSAP